MGRSLNDYAQFSTLCSIYAFGRLNLTGSGGWGGLGQCAVCVDSNHVLCLCHVYFGFGTKRASHWLIMIWQKIGHSIVHTIVS